MAPFPLHTREETPIALDKTRIVEQAASKTGCASLKPPFSYLGSKVGGLMSRIQSWDEIMNTLAARLSKWKMKTLSIGGRLTLLKSVLGSMPIYHLSLFKAPSKAFKGWNPFVVVFSMVLRIIVRNKYGSSGTKCWHPKRKVV
ncbi:hypothetical protein Tco_0075635 [Tanacetum coccineum]